MIKSVLSVVGMLLSLSAGAWSMPQAGACGGNGCASSAGQVGPQMCLLVQDPWQDCGEDPWQLTAVESTTDAVSDPWQDSEDPWQPFPALMPAGETPDATDPWQPLVSSLPPAGPDDRR